MALNIVQQERQMQRLPDDMLRQMLIQMTQTGQVGTPQYILAAGEIQTRKDARQKAMAGQGNTTPVISDLLTGGAMPPQMPTQTAMLPEDAGGIAALPAPNMDNIAEMAAGGLVAFEDGGRVARFQAGGVPLVDVLRTLTMDERRFYQQTGRLPERAQAMLTGQIPLPVTPTPGMGKAGTGPATITMLADPNVPAQMPLPRDMRFYPGVSPLIQQQTVAAPSATGVPTGTADARAQMRQAENVGLAALRQQTSSAPTVREKTDGTTPAVSAAPAVMGVPGSDYSNIFSQALGFAKQAIPDEPAPTEPEKRPKQLIEERNQLYKDLGIEDPTKLRREQLEKEMQEAKTEKEQAGWMRLAEFGFNWASQNGPTLQAAAKAGAAVTPGLMSDLKDLRKLDRDRQKELAGLAALDAQAQRATADSVLAEIEKRREQRENRLQRIEDRRATVAASLAGSVISAETQKSVASLQLQAAKLTRDTTLAKLAEQLSETETKNIIDAATSMVTKRMDYATLTDEEKKNALLEAVRTIKQGRALASTTVTPR